MQRGDCNVILFLMYGKLNFSCWPIAKKKRRETRTEEEEEEEVEAPKLY